MFIIINNLKIHYHQQGKGKPLLILHGWGRGSQSWQKFLDFVKHKAETQQIASWQIIIPDLPGLGQSEAPPSSWGVSDYVNFVFQFLEKLNIKDFFLLGHSFGGRIAIKMAAMISQDNKSEIRDTRPQLNHFQISRLYLCSAAGIKHPFTTKQKFTKLLAKIGGKIFNAETGYGSFLRKILYKLAGSRDYLKTHGIMRQVFQKIIAEDLTPLISKIKLPTTIIWGDRDKLVSIADGLFMQSKISGSDLIILKGIGHNIQQEAAEELWNCISLNLKCQMSNPHL